jgi:hypothetical protein
VPIVVSYAAFSTGLREFNELMMVYVMMIERWYPSWDENETRAFWSWHGHEIADWKHYPIAASCIDSTKGDLVGLSALYQRTVEDKWRQSLMPGTLQANAVIRIWKSNQRAVKQKDESPFYRADLWKSFFPLLHASPLKYRCVFRWIFLHSRQIRTRIQKIDYHYSYTKKRFVVNIDLAPLATVGWC